MFLAGCAMVYSAIIEVVRKNDIKEHWYIEQSLAGDSFNASKISMFAQVPEFAFIGSSEVFASISGESVNHFTQLVKSNDKWNINSQ